MAYAVARDAKKREKETTATRRTDRSSMAATPRRSRMCGGTRFGGLALPRTCNTQDVEDRARSEESEASGLFEDAKVDRDGRLVVPCADVPEAVASLASRECLRAVLARMRDEARVGGGVLVPDRE